MKKEEIRNRIAEWGKKITVAYPGLRVRFEFSKQFDTYLVSLYPDVLPNLDEFSAAVLAFEDEMENLYGDSAPLFCDNDELFSPGPQAELIMGLCECPKSSWSFKINAPVTFNQEYNLAA